MIVVIDTNVWISALQFAKHRGTKADLLIAGDKDLLTLGEYKGTRIITPEPAEGLASIFGR